MLIFSFVRVSDSTVILKYSFAICQSDSLFGSFTPVYKVGTIYLHLFLRPPRYSLLYHQKSLAVRLHIKILDRGYLRHDKNVYASSGP